MEHLRLREFDLSFAFSCCICFLSSIILKDSHIARLMNLNVNVNADPDSTGLFPGNFSNMLGFLLLI